MKAYYPYLVAVGTACCSWFALRYFVDTNNFATLYDNKLQLVFFTAFLTVGSFLLAMKAFILVRIKDDIYRHDEYKKRYLYQSNNEYRGDYYKGLIELGNLLAVSVVGSFLTAIIQVTVGFSKIYCIKIIAPSFVGGMLVLVLLDWFYVYMNLRDWFKFIEKDIAIELKNGRE